VLKKVHPLTWVCTIAALVVVFSGQKGCELPFTPFAPPAPFAADVLTVLVTRNAGDTGSVPNWAQGNTVATVEGWTKEHKGEFRILDATSDPKELAAKWKAALAVPKTNDLWIVAAGPKSGFSMPLTDKAAVFKALEGVR